MTGARAAYFAQDHFLHGHLLGSWITDYIDLEESLAVGSICQEELAHAAALWALQAMDDVTRDALVYERDPAEWAPSVLVTACPDGWPAATLRGLLLAHAAMVRSRWLLRSPDTAARRTGEVLLAEQRLHVLHWERWVRLLSEDPVTWGELKSQAEQVLPLGADVFGAVPGADPADGEEAAGRHEEWRAGLAPVLDLTGVDGDLLGAQPARRRAGTDQPALLKALGLIRSLRPAGADGVRGLYR